ncbi:MAG TPA: hypothetical protein VMQ83_01315 [Gammaproteobacteria bacterium]|nr:hypothetical protein [Gammaproteobacteria bacterium]
MTETLGLADEDQQGTLREIAMAALAAAGEIGVAARVVRTAADEAAVDTLLLIGFPRIAPNMLARPKAARRILWLEEPLPPAGDGRLRRGLRRATPPVRVVDPLHSLASRAGLGSITREWRETAAIERERLRTLASLRSARSAFDEYVVTTETHRRSLAAEGLTSRVVHLGYHPLWAGRLVEADAPRDVALLSFGQVHPRTRREGAHARLAAGLPPEMTLRVERNAYGDERAALLNRTRIVVDIQRVPGNFASIRMMLAAAAGAAYVSEPIDDAGPWISGLHYLSSPLDEMPSLLGALLADEQRRRTLVAESQRLITEKLSLTDALRAILHGRS